MKNVKRILTVMSVCFLLFPLFVQATEEDLPQPSSCEIAIRLTVDPAASDIVGDIAIGFKNIETQNLLQYILRENDKYVLPQPMPLPPNAEYEVSYFIQPSGFAVVGSDGKPIERLSVKEGVVELNLRLVKAGAGASDAPEANAQTETAREDGGASESAAATPKSVNEVMQKFYEQTAYIIDNPDFKRFFESNGNTGEKSASYTLYANDGGTIEEWRAMSDYERSNYKLLYLMPKASLLGPNSDVFGATKEKYMETQMRSLANVKKMPNGEGEALYNAFVEFWEWQWNEWETNHRFVNVFDETEYGYKDKEEGIPDFQISVEEEKELAEDVKEALKDEPVIPTGMGEGTDLTSKETFFAVIKSRLPTFVLCLIVLIALAAVVIRNRKKNIPKDDE